ncbi:MAG: DUF4336 domain-containing protein [Myxococcales bacterium]|nr:DUF4336 domain-containing protein [Myxococcales bacterium]
MDQQVLTEFRDGLWLSMDSTRFLGLHMPTTMTVMRLESGGLLLYSPLAATGERRAAVEAIGDVEHIYAPSLFHYLSVADWAQAYPDAKVHGPEGLPKKAEGLNLDRANNHGDPGFRGVSEIPIEGCRLGETVLFHEASKTLICADLVHNIGRPDHTWTKVYSKLMGFYDDVALSRVLRWTAFSDKAAARASVNRVLATGLEQLVVGHGTPVENAAANSLATALQFLPGEAAAGLVNDG